MSSSAENGAVDAAVPRMSVDKDEKPEEPAADPDPTPLAPGVWVTEAPGFACVPPRAQSDFRNVAATPDEADDVDDKECDTKLTSLEVEPRIERYRER
jgi:hypothetical protein